MFNLKKISVIVLSVSLLSGCSSTAGRNKNNYNKSIISSQYKTPDKRSFVGQLGAKKDLDERLNHNKSCLIKPYIKLSNSYSLDPNKSLKVDISDFGYTRFFIEDERITDVFVYPQESIAVQIHKQGYLIVVPKKDSEDSEAEENIERANDGIYLTVTGEEGTTQDFFLRFTGKNPEPVRFYKSGAN